VDEVLCVFFKAPHTYTTEDTVEIQGHGGLAACCRILELALTQGCRLARPGEFTLRAFLGGRIDLSQAEAVAQMVEAQSDLEARLALGALAGGLARRLAPVRQSLVKAAAAVEAAIDFPDEAEEITGPALTLEIRQQALEPLTSIVEERKKRRCFREGAVVVLCGRPNVGKSSLFNALLGQDRAIVTQVPGTTRDSIEEAALLGGVVCRLVDTAGLGEASGLVDSLGMEAARQRLVNSDLALVVLDGSQGLTPEDRDTLAATGSRPRVMAVNKADLEPAWELTDLEPGTSLLLRVSALTGEGLDELARQIGAALTQGQPEPAPGEVVISARQAQALQQCLEATDRAAKGLEQADIQPELVSVDVAQALEALGEVDGQGAPDQVIEEVFSTFCVGK
jgi:tRNA modification GTPase